MSKKVLLRVTGNTRLQGAEFLALCTLANSADDDGLYWPTSWKVADARVRQDDDNIVHSLEKVGEVVRIGNGRFLRFWVAIAFTPREMKEIAIRRLHMTGEDAIAFVSEIVYRQIN